MLHTKEELYEAANKYNINFDGEAEDCRGNFAYYQFTTIEGRTFAVKEIEELPAKIEEVRIRFEEK